MLDAGQEAVAMRLYSAWRRGRDPETRRRLLVEQPLPGAVALRARFHYLTDEKVRTFDLGDLDVAIEKWLREIELESEGDEALRANDTARARRAFEALVDGESSALHWRLAQVHSLIGLGDAARQIDETDQAIVFYEAALSASEAIDHRFGEVRALVPLAYIALNTASALEADALFARAEEISTALDERLYLANALIGRGETLQRRRRFDEGRDSLRRALDISRALQSPVAIGNAAQRLADLELRSGNRNDALPLLEQASEAYEAAGVAIGAATAADSLADLLLDAGRVDEAERAYERAQELSRNAGYRRGEAHALTGNARCAEARAEFTASIGAQTQALEIYESLDDLVGRTSARAGLARATSGLGDHTQSVAHWLSALSGIEEMRTLRDRSDLQDEYRLRFSETYAGGLREAVKAEDAAGFVTVFESLAGRRLAGLVEQSDLRSEHSELQSQIVARANDRLLHPSPNPSREDRLRRIGAATVRFAIRDEARSSFDSILVAAQIPIDRAVALRLVAERPSGTETLLLALIPDSLRDLAWLWRSENGDIELGVSELPQPAADLISALQHGSLANRTADDLLPLAPLIPPALAEHLQSGTKTLLLIPIDELWAIPFAAVTLPRGRLLGETTPLLLCPSLSLHVALSAVERPDHARPRLAKIWRSPDVARHDLDPVFVDDQAWCATSLGAAWQATEALTRADADALVVVVCHGRPDSHLGHYLELEPGTPLTPADLVNASRTPGELVVISCWGAATPQGRSGDPITIATLALTRGSRLVGATLSELADSHAATVFTRAFIHRLRDRSMPLALRDATAQILRDEAIRHGALRHWAPLAILGAV